MRKTIKRVILLAFLVAAGLLLFWSFQPKPLQADWVQTGRGLLQVTIDEEGQTRVRDTFTISAPAAGRILRIELQPGDTVRAGSKLVTLLPADPTPLDIRTRATAEARVQAAEAALGRARAQQKQASEEREFARTQLERYGRLLQQGVIARERVEALESEVRAREEASRAAEFTVRSAEHEVEVARTSLLSGANEADHQAASLSSRQPFVIRSPVDGVVLRRLRESEALVAPGEPLLVLGDPGDLEIVADLLSTDAVQVRPGSKVVIERWGGALPLQGRLRRVEPAAFTKVSPLGIEEQRVNVIIDFEDPHEAWQNLGEGYRVEVSIVIWEKEDTLKIPTGSLFRNAGHWTVFVVEDGKAVLRRLEIGRQNGLEAEVLEGLSEGDQVILYPSDAISEGTPVVPR